MHRRNVLSLSAITALGFALLSDNALAQQAADVEGVKAASKVLLCSLGGTRQWCGNGKGVGSHALRHIRRPALKKYWVDTDPLFSQRNVTLSDQHIHVNGNLAWEMGQEGGTPKMKDGKDATADYIVTNVYEKVDGRWLIVSHHVQPKPQ